MATASWQSLWLTSLLGLFVLASGCAGVVVSPEPYRCPPLTPELLAEYEQLFESNQAPGLRAWIRETERACRANEALLGD